MNGPIVNDRWDVQTIDVTSDIGDLKFALASKADGGSLMGMYIK